MRANVRLRAGLRLAADLLLLVALSVIVCAAHPGETHAASAPDSTIIYVVQPGDTLRSIAAAKGTSIAAIVRANRLVNPDVIYPGQKLVIQVQGGSPAGSTSAPGSATASPTGTSTPVSFAADTGEDAAADVYYTVQLGDMLASIGAGFGVSASAISAANNIDHPDLIWVGQKLLIPGAAQPGATASPTPAAVSGGAPTPQPTSEATPPAQPAQLSTPTPQPALPEPTVYIAQPGDTLGTIAARFDTTVAAIVAVNDLPNSDMLGIGQQLIIPQPGEASSAALRPSKLVVSISQQRCWLYQGDTVIAKWVCSTGRPGAGTRPGSFKIQSKMSKAFGSTWNIWMPYWLGVYWAGASENGIHGLPWSASSGAQVWTGYVGTPITFGCIMLDNVNAKMLYAVAWIGMPVIIDP